MKKKLAWVLPVFALVAGFSAAAPVAASVEEDTTKCYWASPELYCCGYGYKRVCMSGY